MEYVIENNDILNVESVNVIPSYVESFTESALYIAEAIEKDYNDLFMNIGISELAVFESTGMQIVYEGEEKKSFINKVVDFFKQAWTKIKGAFEKMLVSINAKIKNVKKNAVKIDKSDVDKIPDDKDLGQVYSYPSKTEKYAMNAKSFAADVSTAFNRLVNAKETDEGLLSAARENSKKEAEKLMGKVCAEVSGISGVTTVKEMTDAIDKELKGELVKADKKYISANFSTIVDTVTGTGIIKKVKDSYKGSKELIDSMIKTVKGFDDARITFAQDEITVLKSIVTVSNNALSKAIEVEKRKLFEHTKIVLGIMKYSKKAVKESAEVELEESSQDVVSRQLDLIESAFNW